ncbi:MAG: flagellar export chaperone FliS [Phycisphaerae bacterium]|nr:flagellar export chaperone FliS [Phycisphaerae bacterium]
MNAAIAYQETAVTTQTKGGLIVLLYDGAICFLKKAGQCIGQEDIAGRNRNIGRARNIIFELNSTLDLDRGGSVAQNLRSLYNFIWRYLGDANIKNDTRMLKEIIAILDNLRQGWEEITRHTQSTRLPKSRAL